MVVLLVLGHTWHVLASCISCCAAGFAAFCGGKLVLLPQSIAPHVPAAYCRSVTNINNNGTTGLVLITAVQHSVLDSLIQLLAVLVPGTNYSSGTTAATPAEAVYGDTAQHRTART